jgi:hypothetical protein
MIHLKFVSVCTRLGPTIRVTAAHHRLGGARNAGRGE